MLQHGRARPGTVVTCHRVAAAESWLSSAAGRARSASAPPVSAASWRRRVAAMVSRPPSAMTAATAAHRSARSIDHSRAPSSGGATKIDRSRSRRSPFVSALPLAPASPLPTSRRGYGHT